MGWVCDFIGYVFSLGALGTHNPLSVQSFSFSYSFRENWPNYRLAPDLRGRCPLPHPHAQLGNPAGSATDFAIYDIRTCVKNHPKFRFEIWTSGGSRISPRRGRQLSGGGRQHTILPNFPKNCMKLKEFGPPFYTPTLELTRLPQKGSGTKHTHPTEGTWHKWQPTPWNGRHVWKHYLPPTTVAGCNNKLQIISCMNGFWMSCWIPIGQD